MPKIISNVSCVNGPQKTEHTILETQVVKKFFTMSYWHNIIFLLYLDAVSQLNTPAVTSSQYRILQTTPKATSPVAPEKSSFVAETAVRTTKKTSML